MTPDTNAARPSGSARIVRPKRDPLAEQAAACKTAQEQMRNDYYYRERRRQRAARKAAREAREAE